MFRTKINKAFTLVEVLVVLAIIGMACIFIMAGCYAWNSGHVTEGIVTNKQFIAEHTESETHYTEIGDIKIPVTTSHKVPDQYIIWLEGTYNDKTYTRRVLVDRQSYKLLRQGQHFKISDLPLMPTAEEPNG